MVFGDDYPTTGAHASATTSTSRTWPNVASVVERVTRLKTPDLHGEQRLGRRDRRSVRDALPPSQAWASP
jgi:hypothetical protein